jgi:signal peptidase I
MSSLTAALYATLIFYGLGWFLGYWIGNFSLLLFVLTLFTLAYWLAEHFRFKPARIATAAALREQDTERRAQLAKMGITQVDNNVDSAVSTALAQPWWLDWTAGLFPVILIVFLLRSFLFEPFKIPSGSMIPTLMIGDLILVNKFHFGVRLPVLGTKLIANHDPQAGDVVVFHYPVDPRIDYIKRVVAVPGDKLVYAERTLTINGKRVETRSEGEFYDEDSMRYSQQFSEHLGKVDHRILVDPRRMSSYGIGPRDFPHGENCNYTLEAVTCTVPAGHYFVMGDNRDNSQDSRYWGFVPDENIVGKAFLVWMNFSNIRRIGTFQ